MHTKKPLINQLVVLDVYGLEYVCDAPFAIVKITEDFMEKATRRIDIARKAHAEDSRSYEVCFWDHIDVYEGEKMFKEEEIERLQEDIRRADYATIPYRYFEVDKILHDARLRLEVMLMYVQQDGGIRWKSLLKHTDTQLVTSRLKIDEM